MFLASIGAGADVLGAFSSHCESGLTLARVAMAQRDVYWLLTEQGGVQAEPSGGLYYRAASKAEMPVTGDWVAARVVGEGQAMVEAVLPRKSMLSRRAAGRREDEQALAANVDVVFLVCGLDGDYNLRRIERYLALVEGSGAATVVVLNKADLCGDLERRVAETRAVARRAEVVTASTLAEGGLEGVRRYVGAGRTVALLGSSGVGKSSLANGLLGEARLATREVRVSDSRGRHTTVRRELVVLPGGGALIDTPGMRELQLWVGAESVEAVFDEIQEAAERCRFRDCTHRGEPGCAVAEAVERGEVDAGRWASFQKLQAEAEWHETRVDPLAALARKRKWKAIHKQIRMFNKGFR